MNELIYNPPRQKRSQQSLERFLDAAESLIKEHGFDEISVHDVAKKAGFSVGGLYARFPTKTSLLSAVRARFLDRQRAILTAEFEMGRGRDQSLDGALERAIGLLFHHFMAEGPIFRAFLVEESRDCSRFAEGCEAAYDYRRTLFREALLAHRDEITHPDPAGAIDWVFAILSALIKDRLIHGEAAKTAGGYSDVQLLSRIKQMALVYLACRGVDLPGTVEPQATPIL